MIIKRIKGDTYPIDIQILDSDDVAINLTGSTVFFTVKRNIEDTDAQALISKSVTSHSSPTTGETSIPILASEADIDGNFFYDIKIKSATSVITSVYKDEIIFSSHVTIRTV